MDLTSQGLPLSSPVTLPKSQARKRTVAGEVWGISKTFLKVLGAFSGIALAMTVWQFPYETGAVGVRRIDRPENYSEFYGRIYKAPDPNAPVVKEREDDPYVATAKWAIENDHIIPRVKAFVSRYGLEKAHVLDVGSGTGYLQDVVQDYVGLDISSTAVRYYHKPFVEASATEMPLPDNEFDAAWTIWVLEHVPNPEQALLEIRRVVKDGGILFMNPAWHVTSYGADGYPVRPYSDFDLAGKFHKTAYFVQNVAPFPQLLQTFTRAGLWAQSLGAGPTKLHYRSIQPNYDKYWMADSDAINWLDRYEMALWFTSRGDECLNCSDRFSNVWDELVIRVHKESHQ